MRKFAIIFVLTAIPVLAQQPDELTRLRQENALLRIQVTNLQSALVQAQAEDAGKKLAEAHAKAVADLEALNPGKKWDEQRGELVDKKVDGGQAK